MPPATAFLIEHPDTIGVSDEPEGLFIAVIACPVCGTKEACEAQFLLWDEHTIIEQPAITN